MQEQYWVWMSQVLGTGTFHTDRILSRFGGAREFYEAGEEGFLAAGFPEKDCQRMHSYPMVKAMEICEEARRLGMTILTPDSPGYPQRLREIPGMPLTLYVKGQLGDMDESPAVAVVGTRRASRYGLTVARRFSKDMAAAGAVIVSGMALGIDAEAHWGALEGQGRTVAVLGCGLDICYPPENRDLMDAILRRGGAVISEYAPGSAPVSFHFPQRNRIIAGLSMGVFMVEADYGSGALLTVKNAMEQGRDVFTVPHGLYDPHAAVSLALIRDGVIPVGCARHILEEYESLFPGKLILPKEETHRSPKKEAKASRQEQKVREEPKPVLPHPVKMREPVKAKEPDKMQKPKEPPKPEKKAVPVSAQAQEILNCLEDGEKTINELSALTGLAVPRVLSAATELELSGLAGMLPGRRVKKCS